MIHQAKNMVRSSLQRFGLKLNRVSYRLIDYSQYESESVENRRFYNFGAGTFFHPCWTNVDLKSGWYQKKQIAGFINHDLSKKQPVAIPNETAEVIYSGNMIEHIDNVAGLYFLKDAYRVLKPGGIIRIVCPDVDLAYTAYQQKEQLFYSEQIERYSAPGSFEDQFALSMSEASPADLFLNFIAAERSRLRPYGKHKLDDDGLDKIINESPTYESALDSICEPCRFNPSFPQYHINWMNKVKLLEMMREAGFTNVRESAYGQSSAPPLRNLSFFDTGAPLMSLYLEASKQIN